ncbi:hypothetical protein [Algoriphagus sp. Y33]|uniref:hypothetical protein n=1 Tax=Algoriphagus sp. Y33 TaxID=2772483 RepID=UPI001780AE94|nr:hypothetical protein [Algoriphagus sp. Y33]
MSKSIAIKGVMDNMVNGMGRSGRAAANGIATTNAVAIGATETASKTSPVQSMADYIKETVKNWFE